MKKTLFIVILPFALIFAGCSQPKKNITIKGEKLALELLTSDNFSTNLSNWVVEQQLGGSVGLTNDQLDIDDASGCTVWFNQKFAGDIVIEYDAIVLDQGGPHDRVSDLNCFWMATDIDHEDFFANSLDRGGKFQNYHDLKLYYVGLGGHDNTKTRFRRYEGGGERPCLPQHDLDKPEYLITANELNRIRLVVFNGTVQYYRNEQLIFDHEDPEPYTEGYFGLRTYKNHMLIDNFKVYKIIK